MAIIERLLLMYYKQRFMTLIYVFARCNSAILLLLCMIFMKVHARVTKLQAAEVTPFV